MEDRGEKILGLEHSKIFSSVIFLVLFCSILSIGRCKFCRRQNGCHTYVLLNLLPSFVLNDFKPLLTVDFLHV